MDCQEDLENLRPLNHRWSYRKRLVDPLMDLQTVIDKTMTATRDVMGKKPIKITNFKKHGLNGILK